MKQTTSVKIYVTRGDIEDIEVEVEVLQGYDRGIYLEKNHPMNGYNEGFYCDYDSHTCKQFPDLELTKEEENEACEKAATLE